MSVEVKMKDQIITLLFFVTGLYGGAGTSGSLSHQESSQGKLAAPIFRHVFDPIESHTSNTFENSLEITVDIVLSFCEL